ncbi:benzoate 4-monooxygenase cytochrome P450 [Zopfia rhizophila CBS 207.26]|uniref:Benzoate 4-monooxygenase cytochrome P450 n=1 Tax=Zopfia rhizophila CBS 207.26 TaxID=1314779 RepID=A0A6A6E926_9PEZI|nr:benzoate 4-monooxygenase cytochrome P450 [Zopfia rhizophila CBS 207.26]
MLETVLPPVSRLLLSCVTITIVYTFLICIYRVTLHPLAKYPGPLRYKLSSWPRLWQAYKGKRHIWHLKDHEEYGPIVRIAPNTLSFNTETAMHAIYGSRNINVRKGEWYKTFDIAAGTYSSFTETDKDKHAAKRRWMSPVFSDASQKVSEPLILGIIQRFCDTIKPHATEEWGTKWNMSVLATYLGFDIMGGLVFGCDFRSVDREENRDLANSILPAAKFLYWVSYLPMAWLVRPLLRTKLFEIIGGKPVVDNNRLIDHANGQVQARSGERNEEKGDSPNCKDFLSYLVSAKDRKTGWQPTRADLDTECLNMMNAGADPYSGVLAGVIFYLLHNETVLRKATSEIRSTFSSPDEICSGSKLNSCIYLYACIEESLRRTAPVPSHLPRVVLPGGISIDGHHIPAGSVVGVSAYTIHHNPEYFPDPWSFCPERWIESESNSRKSIDLARRAFEPFGLGIRQCIGKNFAYLQLKLTIAHILFRYDMRLDPDDRGLGGGRPDFEEGRHRVDEFQLWDALGFGRDGPMVQFKNAME